jgi:16S rRNA (uracil1498-N3)-methyltransferase
VRGRLALPTAHHAREVLRLRAGAPVRVFDGKGAEYEAVLSAVTREGVALEVGARVPARPEPPWPLVLGVSALKGDRMEWVVQKATELGAAEIRPFVSQRTDAAARPALLGSRHERWLKVAAGAAEQCGRAVVPAIAPTVAFAHLARGTPGGARLLLERSASLPFAAGATRLSVRDGLLLVVGPAGGFAPEELRAAQGEGVTPVRLGPRTLRTETAAVAAMAVAQALWGDLA